MIIAQCCCRDLKLGLVNLPICMRIKPLDVLMRKEKNPQLVLTTKKLNLEYLYWTNINCFCWCSTFVTWFPNVCQCGQNVTQFKIPNDTNQLLFVSWQVIVPTKCWPKWYYYHRWNDLKLLVRIPDKITKQPQKLLTTIFQNNF